MRIFKLILALAVCGAYVWLLSNPIQLKDQSLPAFGKLLNPFSGFWQNAAPVLSKAEDLELELPSLKGKAQVVWDERGVPHIFAESLEDAYYVQGYLMARDRLWQLDISTRRMEGRLSEVLGSRTLEVDKEARKMGFARAAQAYDASVRKFPEYKYLEAYSKGVNDWVAQLTPAEWPVEFKLIGYSPSEWSPYRTALFVKSMALTLCARAEDVRNSHFVKAFGMDAFQELYPDWNPQQDPVIPPGTSWSYASAANGGNKEPQVSQAQDLGLGGTPTFGLTHPEEGIGSNNWAVAGSKTASGHAILCNDPHLSLTLPSIWYELQIHTPDCNVYGVGLPGIPGVIIGFNDHIAWGVTNASHDVLDYYSIEWTNGQKKSYLLDGQPKQAEMVVEKIAVKGQKDPVLDTVYYTHWGPIVSRDSVSGKDLAIHWLAAETPEVFDLNTFIGLNKARSLQEYQTAISHYHTPSQNFIVATAAGEIGLTVGGQLPLRKKGQGKLVQDGSQSNNQWGYIPRNHNPMAFNPKRGYIFSANQNSTDPSYPYYYNGYFDDWRGRLIGKMLDTMKGITPATMQRMQNNAFSLDAQESIASMAKLADTASLNAAEKRFLQQLVSWNCTYTADSKEAVMFSEWKRLVQEMTWDEWPETKQQMLPDWWRTLALMRQQVDSRWFDVKATPSKETAVMVVSSALKKAVLEIPKLMAPTPENPKGRATWALYRNSELKHLGRLGPFGRGQLSAPGDANAINSLRPNGVGPSWRMVVEMSQPVKAWGVFPGGQSGNPGDANYDHMLDEWSSGKYFELWKMKDAAEQNEQRRNTWTITPAKK